MNKQEFRKTIRNMEPPKHFSAFIFKKAFNEGFNSAKNNALFNSFFLNEPEKPVVPQFVADFYESIKDNFETKLYNYFVEFYNGWEDSNSDFDHWFNSSAEPIQTLVKMKLFGYVVKEEKLYKARNKLTNGYLCKKYDCWAEAFRFKKEDGEALTKEIWEELGVWDNKVYEMEEVEE